VAEEEESDEPRRKDGDGCWNLRVRHTVPRKIRFDVTEGPICHDVAADRKSNVSEGMILFLFN
jgi:hypothetical protein